MNPCDLTLIQCINQAEGGQLWIADENITADLVSQIQGQPHLQAITNRCDIGEALSNRGISTIVNDFDFSVFKHFRQITYRVSKERVLVQHCIDNAFDLLEPGGRLTLIGEKKDGVKTHGKYAEQGFNTKATIDKNGLSYTIDIHLPKTKKNITKEVNETDSYHRLQLIENQGLSFYSKPGLYGWKKIDAGSRLLIETLESTTDHAENHKLSLLDLGCGYGYLTMEAARLGFVQLSATDNNVAAITAAEKNFSNLDLKVTLSLDNCGKNLKHSFDRIICNPPFHQGFSHDHKLIKQFVGQSLQLLSPKGIAYFVVNNFIPLPSTAKELGGHIELVANAHGFKVFKLFR